MVQNLFRYTYLYFLLPFLLILVYGADGTHRPEPVRHLGQRFKHVIDIFIGGVVAQRHADGAVRNLMRKTQRQQHMGRVKAAAGAGGAAGPGAMPAMSSISSMLSPSIYLMEKFTLFGRRLVLCPFSLTSGMVAHAPHSACRASLTCRAEVSLMLVGNGSASPRPTVPATFWYRRGGLFPALRLIM